MNKINKTKKTLAKSTTALTCLLTAAIIYGSLETAEATTTSGTFTVSTNVGQTCSFSVSAINFGAYVPASNSEQMVAVYQNCTVGTTGVVSFQTAVDSGTGEYRLYRGGTPSSTTADYLTATFGTAGYNTTLLYPNGASFSAQGTGSSDSIGIIYAQIASGQTARQVGTFTRAITLVVTY